MAGIFQLLGMMSPFGKLGTVHVSQILLLPILSSIGLVQSGLENLFSSCVVLQELAFLSTHLRVTRDSCEILKKEWVICRVFQKSSGGKKIHISGLVKLSSYGDELKPSILPPLMDSSPQNSNKWTNIGDKSHVSCFSHPMEDQKPQEAIVDGFNTSLLAPSSSSNMSPASVLFSKTSPSNFCYSSQILPNMANFPYSNSVTMPEHSSILRMLLENLGPNMNLNSKRELSQDTGLSTDMSSVVTNHELVQKSFVDPEDPLSSAIPIDLDCLWNY
ncbi:unnamed protein product [Dovyalis caffra]|uniref:Uncharacterized protein n=1 Tax=Dovyalis caffra TaxID=77055 RepID=A0AAV1QN05_9ROSI|nr:unnamed protein product [Dovyalis caffra]